MVACHGLYEPTGAIKFDPPPEYTQYWHETEGCSLLHGNMKALDWFYVPGSSFLSRSGKQAAGMWDGGHTIYLAEAWKDYAPIVRHEMLHALLGNDQTYHQDPAWIHCWAVGVIYLAPEYHP